jgi:hypothetical protein
MEAKHSEKPLRFLCEFAAWHEIIFSPASNRFRASTPGRAKKIIGRLLFQADIKIESLPLPCAGGLGHSSREKKFVMLEISKGDFL